MAKTASKKSYKSVEKETISILEAKILNIETELISFKKKVCHADQEVSELRRENITLKKKLVKEVTERRNKISLVKIKDHAMMNMEQEVQKLRQDETKMAKIILDVEKNRDESYRTSEEFSRKVSSLMTESRANELEKSQMRKNIARLESQLKQMENMYHATRSEKDALDKQHSDLQATLSETTKKLSTCQQRLKDSMQDMKIKQETNSNLNNDVKDLLKKNSSLTKRIESIMSQMTDANLKIDFSQTESQARSKQISQLELQISQEKRLCSQISHERDAQKETINQLRNKLLLCEEKQKASKSSIQLKEKEIQEKDQLLVLMETRKKSAEDCNAKLSEVSRNLNDREKSLVQKDAEILKLKVKLSKLQEELESPINVHRWRQLEGSDPSHLELIDKVNVLKRMLCTQSQQFRAKEVQNEVAPPKPHPASGDSNNKLWQTVEKKNKKIKCLEAELEVLRANSGGRKKI